MLALAGFASAAGASAPTPAPRPEHVPGELIVRFSPGFGPTYRAEILRENGARRKRMMRLPGTEVVSVARGKSVEAAARELEAEPGVIFAEPNYIYEATATPNDPRFGALWALHQATDRDIDAPEAWEEQTGSAAIDAAGSTTLFVVAAGNASSDNDAFPVYPCSYPSPNLVCVAATDETDALAEFSNYGDGSVDLAAPGTRIESTWPGFTTVFAETFETDLAGRWAGGGSPNTWGCTSARAAGGSFSVTDSPAGNYRNHTDNWLRLTTPINLSGQVGCHAAYAMSLGIEDNYDLVSLETSANGSTWEGVDWYATDTLGGGFEQIESALFDLSGAPTGYLRFRLETDNIVTDDGVYIDDLRVRCIGTTYSSDDYRRLDGTSMASPHAAGVAALVWAENPAVSVSTVRSALLASVDQVPSLAGAVATGGRLNADRAVRSVSTAPPLPPPSPSLSLSPPSPPPPPAPPPPAPPPLAAPLPPPPPPAAQARCVVPNVKGKTVSQARRLLKATRCALGKITRKYSAKVRRGRVVSQSRRVGARLPRATRVNVVVSRGRRRR